MVAFEGRQPGPGVHLTDEERHAYHHYLIAERRTAWLGTPRRSGLNHHLRREANKLAWATLKNHLIGEHGVRRSFLGCSFPDAEAIHDARHREQG